MALFIPTNTEFFNTIVLIFWNLNQKQKKEGKKEKKVFNNLSLQQKYIRRRQHLKALAISFIFN
jgi:hypothetical protein